MGETDSSKVDPQDGRIPDKTLAPGLNSWAQSHRRQESKTSEKEDPRPTNRDRYKNKPMPKIPLEAAGQTPLLQPRAYIQPAIPLVGHAPKPKNRAVTDPVAPKPLFTGRKPSVTQLRKAFGHSKHGSKGDKQLSPSFEYPTGKAAEVLGLTPVLTGPKRSPAPSSARMDPVDANDTGELSDVSSGLSANARHEIQSSSVPDNRHLTSESGNNSAADINSNPNARSHHWPDLAPEGLTGPVQSQQRQRNATLTPPKIASYGKVGEVGVVKGNGMHRVESFRGIIESAASPIHSEEQNRARAEKQFTPKSASTSQHNEGFEQPNSSSLNGYGGVWENDPAVVSFKKAASPSTAEINHAKGYSLPPFSPMQKSYPQDDNKGEPPPLQNSAVTSPSVFGPSYTNASFPSSGQGSAQPLRNGHLGSHNAAQFAEYQLPLPSANSWAAEPRNSALASVNAPVSALLSPLWSHHYLSNSVPSPPRTRQDYQRPDPLSAGLSHLEMTVHHHIDSAFGSLSRLVTDKHDRVLDQVIRRLENLEDGLGKSFRQMKGDLRGVSTEICSVKTTIRSFSDGNEGIREAMRGLESKLTALEKSLNDNTRQCQQIITYQSAKEEDDRQMRSSTHRRTESAHGVLCTGQDCRKQENGMDRTASRACLSNTSSRGHRSNTLNSQTNGRVSDDRGARREYFAELVAARGPVPDIREHPAYAGVPQPQNQMYDQHGMPIGMGYTGHIPYGTQQLGDGGWYHQAYGSG